MDVLGTLPAYAHHPRRAARVTAITSPEAAQVAAQSDLFGQLEELLTDETTAPLDHFDQLADQFDTRSNAATITISVYVDGVGAHEASVVLRDNPVTFQRDRRTYRSRNVSIQAANVPLAGPKPGRGVEAWAAMRDDLNASTRSRDDTYPH